MTKATDIALKAHEIALAAAEIERAHEEALTMDGERTKRLQHDDDAHAGRALLAPMFPGVEWDAYQTGDYGYDTILMEKGAPWSDPLKILVKRHLIDMDDPQEPRVYRTRIYTTCLVQDTSMPGYSYWTEGREIKSAADVGAFLEGSK